MKRPRMSLKVALVVGLLALAPPLGAAESGDSISNIDGSVLREPLAQIRTRICPGIIGLPQDMAEQMVGRIRFNAERIGLKGADDAVCRPNIIVAFVRTGKADLAELARKQPQAFADLPNDEFKALLAETGPVRSWTNTTVRSRQGDSIRGQKNLVDVPVLNVSNSHSHIFTAHRVDIEGAVVMIDLAAIDGMSIAQIADYATMRSFARTRPSIGTGADTILRLFDQGGSRPSGLTTFDLAYLTSLYGSYDGAKAVAPLNAAERAVREAKK